MRAGMVEPTGIVVDAASGTSGAGRKPTQTTHFNTVDEDFTAYGLLHHRHTPEIEQVVGAEVLFTPHLAPMNRGILATCYARPRSDAPDTEEVIGVLKEAFSGEPFIVVSDVSPSTKATLGSNCAHVTTRVDSRHWVGRRDLRDRQSGEGRFWASCAMCEHRSGHRGDLGAPQRGRLPVSVTAPKGFVAAGIACGIKGSGELDLALVATDDAGSVPSAGVFTANLAAAAPVIVSRSHLGSSGGYASAVVASSGNANAATGDQGVADAQRMCALVGDELGVVPSGVLVCQTGLIGVPLPMAPLEAGMSVLVSARAAGREHARRAATAIMTTDTMCKEVVIEGTGFLVGGMAKGAAMLSPHMTLPDVPHATMLAVLTTDARCGPSELAASLAGAVDATFNRMTLDGCMSTNDTVFVMANGRSGTVPESGELGRTLREACAALAGMMAQDAEGGTKVARIVVTHLPSEHLDEPEQA